MRVNSQTIAISSSPETQISSQESVQPNRHLTVDQNELEPARLRSQDMEENAIRKYASKGARIGFRAGCTLSIIGIPFSNCLTESQYKGHKAKEKLAARKAKRRLPLAAFLCLPGIAVGGIGAGIGWLFGTAYGSVLAHKPKASA